MSCKIETGAVIWALGKSKAYSASDLVQRVLSVLDIVAGGIHHAPCSFDHLDHLANETIGIVWGAALATYDPDTLMRLVLFADGHSLKVEVAPHSSRALALTFSHRTNRNGERFESPGIASLASKWVQTQEVA